MPDIDILNDIIYPAIDEAIKVGLIGDIKPAPDTPILTLTLASERAISRSQSPFRTLKTLADYVAEGPNSTDG